MGLCERDVPVLYNPRHLQLLVRAHRDTGQVTYHIKESNMSQLSQGIADEASEHHLPPVKAMELAEDHLAKYPKYYTELAQAEKGFTRTLAHLLKK